MLWKKEESENLKYQLKLIQVEWGIKDALANVYHRDHPQNILALILGSMIVFCPSRF